MEDQFVVGKLQC